MKNTMKSKLSKSKLKKLRDQARYLMDGISCNAECSDLHVLVNFDINWFYDYEVQITGISWSPSRNATKRDRELLSMIEQDSDKMQRRLFEFVKTTTAYKNFWETAKDFILDGEALDDKYDFFFYNDIIMYVHDIVMYVHEDRSKRL